MARFTAKRWWTCILALSLILACCSLVTRSAFADTVVALGTGDSDPGGVPTGTGDPDNPIGDKKSAHRGAASGGALTYGIRAAGDGAVSGSMWMLRLRVVLQGARAFYFRF